MRAFFKRLKQLARRSDGSLNPLGIAGIILGIFLLLQIAIVAGFVSFIAYDVAFNLPRARQIHAELVREFRQIQPLPAATVVRSDSFHKTSNALVTSSYRTTLSYAEIRAHYDIEMANHGWSFYGEEETRVWGRDYGGKAAHYCKGEYRASLQYAGERAGYDWDYSFSVSWGLDSLMERYSDRFHNVGCR